MLKLLNFLFEEAEPAFDWTSMAIIGACVVAFFVFMVYLPSRRQKKKSQEMQDMISKMTPGTEITTYSGIIGTVITMDETNVWINTGTAENPTTLKMLRQAIYTVNTPQANQEGTKREEAEIDEIK